MGENQEKLDAGNVAGGYAHDCGVYGHGYEIAGAASKDGVCGSVTAVVKPHPVNDPVKALDRPPVGRLPFRAPMASARADVTSFFEAKGSFAIFALLASS